MDRLARTVYVWIGDVVRMWEKIVHLSWRERGQFDVLWGDTSLFFTIFDARATVTSMRIIFLFRQHPRSSSQNKRLQCSPTASCIPRREFSDI